MPLFGRNKEKPELIKRPPKRIDQVPDHMYHFMNETIRDANFNQQPADRDAFILQLMDLLEDWMAMWLQRELSAKQIEQYNKLVRNNQDTNAFVQTCIPNFTQRAAEQLNAWRQDLIATVDGMRV